MPSTLIRGGNAVLYINSSGWKGYLCSRSFSITTNSDMIETSIVGSGNWRTYVASALNFSVSIDGLIAIETTTDFTIDELESLMINGTETDFKIEYEADSGMIYRKEFSGLIESIELTSSFDNVSTFAISIKGTGAITNTIIP